MLELVDFEMCLKSVWNFLTIFTECFILGGLGAVSGVEGIFVGECLKISHIFFSLT